MYVIGDTAVRELSPATADNPVPSVRLRVLCRTRVGIGTAKAFLFLLVDLIYLYSAVVGCSFRCTPDLETYLPYH